MAENNLREVQSKMGKRGSEEQGHALRVFQIRRFLKNQVAEDKLREVQSYVGTLGGNKRKITAQLKRRQGTKEGLRGVFRWLGLPVPKSGLTDADIERVVKIIGERKLREYQNRASKAADSKQTETTTRTKLNKGKKSGGKVYGTPTRKSQYKAG